MIQHHIIVKAKFKKCFDEWELAGTCTLNAKGIGWKKNKGPFIVHLFLVKYIFILFTFCRHTIKKLYASIITAVYVDEF